jgi:trimethylamine:corrinoid methyltransferase-like protein
MRYESAFLSVDEQERVHEASMRILAETGIRFHGERALPMLAEAGAHVDADAGVARLPRELVEAALAKAPRSFVLGARNPAFDYPVPSRVSRYGLDGTAAFARDFETGERRYGTRRDVEDGCRVFQAADLGVMAWAPVGASDMPAPSRVLHEFVAMLRACSKHGQHELHRRDQVPFLAAALVAIAGSEAAVRERHEASLIYCPVAPLVHDGPMLDGYLDLGDLDVPVMIMPMPVAGTTGPASLLGNIVVANAEALSAIVAFQVAHPGRPLLYASALGSMDFRSGAFLAATPEVALESGALTTMGRFYGLPTGSTGSTSDAHDTGPEAVIEKLLTCLPPVAAGADVIVGFGEIDSDQTLVLEQILVDNEIAHLVERLVGGVDGRPGAELLDDVAEVGPGGNYLAQRSTRDGARSGEFHEPSLLWRLSRDTWLDRGRPSMYDRARERVHEILEAPLADPLPDATVAELDRILAEADRDLRE